MKGLLGALVIVGFLVSPVLALEVERRGNFGSMLEIVKIEREPAFGDFDMVTMTVRLKRDIKYNLFLIDAIYLDQDGIELRTGNALVDGRMDAGTMKKVQFGGIPRDVTKIIFSVK